MPQDFLSQDLHLAEVSRILLNSKSVIMGVTFGRAAPVDGGEAPADAAAEGATSPIVMPPGVGLPIWEPLVGNWSRKYLLEGWGLPHNWGTVETPEAAELAIPELKDCLETLGGCVTAGIVGSLFMEIVENVIQEKEDYRKG